MLGFVARPFAPRPAHLVRLWGTTPLTALPLSVLPAAVQVERLASLAVPSTYMYDAEGDRARVMQFQAAGVVTPTNLSFATGGRLLVTPDCYELRP